MIEHDTLQRFLFEKTNIRGELVHLYASYQATSERHSYPLPVKQLLGEALTAAALLSATIKFEGTLILQIHGNGPINLLVTQSNQDLHLRGLAKWEGEIEPGSFAQLTGEGQLAITITPTQGERYQGIVKLTGTNLAASIENYFQQSEQLPTCLIIHANEHVAAGLLLQTVPDNLSTQGYDFWEHVITLARTLKAEELLNLSNQEILHRLFHEEDVRLFEAEPVSFRCGCTIERMERALRLFGYQEALDILKTNKVVTVSCEFCRRHYEFDKVDVERVFVDSNLPPASGVH